MRLLGLLAAYLIGAIPVGYVVARLSGGVDIRHAGSGSIGATNVLRTSARAPPLPQSLRHVEGLRGGECRACADASPAWSSRAVSPSSELLAVVLRFRGGNGVATGLAHSSRSRRGRRTAARSGIVVATVRYVSLGSVMAGLGLPLGVAALGYPWADTAAAVAAAIIIIYRHRENLERLLSGAESRLGQRAPSA